MVSTVIPRTFFINVPLAIALLLDFVADPVPDLRDHPEPGAVYEYDAAVHLELVPDTTLNVPLEVNVQITSSLLL